MTGFEGCFYTHFILSTDTMMIIEDRSYICMFYFNIIVKHVYV